MSAQAEEIAQVPVEGNPVPGEEQPEEKSKKIVDMIAEHLASEDSENPLIAFEYYPPRTKEGVSNLYERFVRQAKQQPLYADVTWGAGGSTSDLTGAISRVTRSSGAWYTCIQVTCNSKQTLLRTNHSHAGTRPTTAPTVRIKPRRTLMLLAPRNKSPVPDVPGVARRRSQRAEPRSNKMRKFFEHSGRIGRVRVLVPTRLFYMAASTVAKPSLCAKRPSQMWTVHTECLMRICGVRKDWFARQGLQPRAKALWARARRPRYRGGGVHSEEASGRQVSASSRGCTGRLRSTTTRGTATVCNAIGSAWQRQRRGASSDG